VTPEDLRYTAQHEWVSVLRPATDDGDPTHLVGITDFAQDALGDIVYVQLPEAGTEVKAGEVLGEVESTKSVSEIYAPVTGVVVARNERLADSPDLLNDDPYGDGWLLEIRPADLAAAEALLDAAAYRDLTETQGEV
jgi:glycine cleavage system H protein